MIITIIGETRDLDVDVRTALLLGAVVGSTDAAATFSIMRRLPVRPRIRATLEAESGFNDPPVIILVTVVASDAWYDAQGLEIAGLVVDAQVRRGGVGRALVAAAEAWARQAGVDDVILRSNVARSEAHAFYPSLGYTLIKTQHAYAKRL